MKKSLIIAVLLYSYTAIQLASSCFAQRKPDLKIVSPRKEAVFLGNRVVFSFFTSNFVLNTDGYLKLSLDQKKFSLLKEQKDVSLANLSEGDHHLTAELVDKKGKPFSPTVKKEVDFTIKTSKEEAVNLKIASEKEKSENQIPFALFFLGSAAVILGLALKLYINTKTGKNGSYQKPLG